MSVYVDQSVWPYRGMVMCHLWADSHVELLAMASRIGVSHRWLQKPPQASWVHFDICRTKRALAVRYGAIETDRYAPLEHVARQNGNTAMIERIARLRANAASR